MTEPAPGIDTSGSHLREEELVDALEGVLPDSRAGHVARCAACSDRLGDLRAIAARAAGADVPEPPPFFWNQLSARVRAAVADEAQQPSLPARWRWLWPAAGAAAALAGIVLLVTLVSGPGAPARDTAVAVAPPAETGDADDAFAGIDQDEAWAVVRALAEDLDHEEMGGEGVSARPGSVERLTLGLSEPERLELARLIEEQLKARRLPESAS